MSEVRHPIAENIAEEIGKLSHICRRFPFYLEDFCRELVGQDGFEMGDEELSLSYRQLKEDLTAFICAEPKDPSPLAAALGAQLAPLLAAQTAKMITKQTKINRYLEAFSSSSARVAYFRNAYSDLAYRRFAKELPAPTVLYRDSFASVCEEVYADRCDFAILPVESSHDGKLTVVEKLIAKYELSPVLYYSVPTADDATLRFGLFSSAPLLFDGANALEVLLFSDEGATLSQLLIAAEYLGVRPQSLSVLPAAQGFAYEWRLVFLAEENPEGFDALWILLQCEYPHHLLCGVFKELI